MPNAFTKLSARAVLAKGKTLAPQLDDPARLNIRPEQVARLRALVDELDATLQEQDVVKSRYEALCGARARQKALLAAALSEIGASVALGEDATDEVQIALGFAVPSTGRTRRLPTKPGHLIAEPTAYGTTELRWARGENGERTMFLIERSDGVAPFAQIGVTTRTRAVVTGCAPGVLAYFRVSAANARGQSAPSSTVAIFAGRVAA